MTSVVAEKHFGGSVLPDDSELGCGYGPFKTGVNDPFLRACVVHDYRYEQHESGSEYEGYSRARADREFLSNMLRIAQNDPVQLVRAYVYYAAVRVLGGFFW